MITSISTTPIGVINLVNISLQGNPTAIIPVRHIMKIAAGSITREDAMTNTIIATAIISLVLGSIRASALSLQAKISEKR